MNEKKATPDQADKRTPARICTVCDRPIDPIHVTSNRTKTHPGTCRKKLAQIRLSNWRSTSPKATVPRINRALDTLKSEFKSEGLTFSLDPPSPDLVRVLTSYIRHVRNKNRRKTEREQKRTRTHGTGTRGTGTRGTGTRGTEPEPNQEPTEPTVASLVSGLMEAARSPRSVDTGLVEIRRAATALEPHEPGMSKFLFLLDLIESNESRAAALMLAVSVWCDGSWKRHGFMTNESCHHKVRGPDRTAPDSVVNQRRVFGWELEFWESQNDGSPTARPYWVIPAGDTQVNRLHGRYEEYADIKAMCYNL